MSLSLKHDETFQMKKWFYIQLMKPSSESILIIISIAVFM